MICRRITVEFTEYIKRERERRCTETRRTKEDVKDLLSSDEEEQQDELLKLIKARHRKRNASTRSVTNAQGAEGNRSDSPVPRKWTRNEPNLPSPPLRPLSICPCLPYRNQWSRQTRKPPVLLFLGLIHSFAGSVKRFFIVDRENRALVQKRTRKSTIKIQRYMWTQTQTQTHTYI